MYVILRFVAWWVLISVATSICTVVIYIQDRGCFSSFADNIGMPLPNHMYFEADFKVFKMYFQYLNTILLYFNPV